MKVVMRGEKIKAWAMSQTNPFKINLPNGGFFQPASIQNLQNDSYYLVVSRNSNELLLEPVRLEG